MRFIDPPNVLNSATAKDAEPLHRLWTGWFVLLAANLNRVLGQLAAPAEHADNAAALAAGLEVGEVYRTGDALKVVH